MAQSDIPRNYNAAEDLVGRNLQAGRAGKVSAIHVTEGQTLEGQAQVLTIE